jgi:hypothetical protein
MPSFACSDRTKAINGAGQLIGGSSRWHATPSDTPDLGPVVFRIGFGIVNVDCFPLVDLAQLSDPRLSKRGLRRVIDISGDGPNNNGAPVAGARDTALDKGITINGLPFMVKEPSYLTMDIDNLDLYYEDCVIGGPGAFVVTIKDREKFKDAIRTKLVLEVADLTPERRIVPVAEKEPRVPCLIGERLWQDRLGN